MKRLVAFMLILFVVNLIAIIPSSATKRKTGPSVTVDLSAVADSPYTEILRIATQPAYQLDQADLVLLRIKADTLSGGTETLIRILPAWTLAGAAISGDPLRLTYPDLLDSTVVSLATTREVMVGPRWGSTANTFHVLPPYLSVELQENRTGGTLVIETLLLHN